MYVYIIVLGFSGRSIQATSTPHPGHQIDARQHGKIDEESFHSKESATPHRSNTAVSFFSL